MRGTVSLVLEGATDAAVARRLLAEAGLEAGPEYVQNGKQKLDRNLEGFNNAARFSCWLVLRDLDRDASCAPELRQRLLPAPSRSMRFHIPVRAVEAWLLADVDDISDVLSVRPALVPRDPDRLGDPKQSLLDLARRSRRRAICDAMVPAPWSGARVGAGYTTTLIEFATDRWRPDIAADGSPSLARLRAFRHRVPSGNTHVP